MATHDVPGRILPIEDDTALRRMLAVVQELLAA
jgi:hypothetical protein